MGARAPHSDDPSGSSSLNKPQITPHQMATSASRSPSDSRLGAGGNFGRRYGDQRIRLLREQNAALDHDLVPRREPFLDHKPRACFALIHVDDDLLETYVTVTVAGLYEHDLIVAQAQECLTRNGDSL